MADIRPYGTWASPVDAAALAASGVVLMSVLVEGDVVWVEERRPAERGRTVIVRVDPSAESHDAVPGDVDVRTRVHEYGGGAYAVRDGVLFAVAAEDQRVYRFDGDPVAVTPDVAGHRYADMAFTPDGSTIVSVRERHDGDGEPVNEIVAFPVDGSREPVVLVSGADFYSFPRVSPDGLHLCWTEWDHPNMPWDASELWLAGLAGDAVSDARRIAGGDRVSVFQPAWTSAGDLVYVADPTGWWNLYRWAPRRGVEAVWETDAEMGVPQWGFNMSTHAVLDDGSIAVVVNRNGIRRIAVVAGGAEQAVLDLEYTSVTCLRSDGHDLVFVGASPREPAAVLRVDPRTTKTEVLRRSTEATLDAAYVSVAEPISFPSAQGRTAHALFYRPTNADFEPPPDERPPLVVLSHGGPTGQTSSAFSLAIQYWTTRGFAVVDVDYGGSTGYGRAYRELLKGNWGIVDVEDCVAAVRYLVDRGDVDAARVAIRGGSAGGFTTLCALAHTDVFRAGANAYGVADLKTLATDTHKFESRYLDGLVGPWPEARALYEQRSPLNHADRISCPVIVLQGLDDPVVPPSQSELIVEALRSRGRPVAYLTFEGESHGFRKAETIRRAREAELSFYAQVFGFTPADPVEPVAIENL